MFAEARNPEIYYGEVTKDYVFVKTRQQEFNYPEGDQNIFSTYDGKGGIGLGSLSWTQGPTTSL